MSDKKPASTGIDRVLAKSIDFELTMADVVRRSERRAWWVAFSAVGMAIMLASGYFFMLPLKEKVPYLVMADAYTGTSTVARLDGDIVDQRISTSEAINRSNVAHFVLARESYDVTIMNLRDWNTVLTMSAPDVAASYQTLYAPTNPDSPYKTYGRDKALRVRLLSTVLIGGNGEPYKGATVRFQRSVYDKHTGATQPLDDKIATLAFTYKPHLKMDEKYRIENPLGFQVTSYRVDTDYAAAPPAETVAPAQRVDPNERQAESSGAENPPIANPSGSGNSQSTGLGTRPSTVEYNAPPLPDANAPHAESHNQGTEHR